MSFKLFFWKKGNANEILLRFQLIAKSIKKLSDIKSKKEKTNEIIEYVKSKLKEAKDEISERAKIEETKPWLTAEQDQEIEDLAEKEISALDELNSNLEEYKELINSAITRQEIDEILAIME
jgi:protein subunit release factor A